MYISHINLWSGIYLYISLTAGIYIYRCIPDHKVFDAKAALYITWTNSLLIMGVNYEVSAYFEGLLMPICRDKKKIKDHRRS